MGLTHMGLPTTTTITMTMTLISMALVDPDPAIGPRHFMHLGYYTTI